MIDEEAEHVLTGDIGPQLVLWDLMKTHKTYSDGQWISGIWASADKALVHQDGLSLWDLSTGHASQILKPGSYVVTAAPGAGVWAIARWLATGSRIRIGKFGRKPDTLFMESRDLSRGMATSLQLSRNGKRLLVLVH